MTRYSIPLGKVSLPSFFLFSARAFAFRDATSAVSAAFGSRTEVAAVAGDGEDPLAVARVMASWMKLPRYFAWTTHSEEISPATILRLLSPARFTTIRTYSPRLGDTVTIFGSEAIQSGLMENRFPLASRPWARASTVSWALAPK